MQLFFLFCKDELAGGLIEYSLIIALIALASVTAMTALGTSITTAFTSLSGKL